MRLKRLDEIVVLGLAAVGAMFVLSVGGLSIWGLALGVMCAVGAYLGAGTVLRTLSVAHVRPWSATVAAVVFLLVIGPHNAMALLGAGVLASACMAFCAHKWPEGLVGRRLGHKASPGA